ncbi:NepR family anti-sigma factor [Roseospira visakhapatnamensis]|uniref:NepR family anti-sigma factor n=1 Tax=Roseospira visakhapatnamensis TaxID=390880 RepID=UPI003CCD6096
MWQTFIRLGFPRATGGGNGDAAGGRRRGPFRSHAWPGEDAHGASSGRTVVIWSRDDDEAWATSRVRHMYDEVVSEPLPESFQSLVNTLRRGEDRPEDRGKEDPEDALTDRPPTDRTPGP